MKLTEVNFDGEKIFLDLPKQEGPNGARGLSLTSKELEDMIQPITNFANSITKGFKKIEPDETELTLQLSAHADNGKILLGLVDFGAEAMCSIKFMWKKDSEKRQE